MCTFELYQSTDCAFKCQWLEIGIPCGLGKGFTNCDTFKDGHTTKRPRSVQKTPIERCPVHGLLGFYDPNRICMVTRIKYHACVCL